MDNVRASKIAEISKYINETGKSVQKSLGQAVPLQENARNLIGQPVQGSGFVRILMYLIATFLLVGILLLAIDQWITPVFQRNPGSPGYISVPGTDTSEIYWPSISEVKDIIIGTPSPNGSSSPPLSTTVLEGQSIYSITMDILISDEYPQVLTGSGETQRILFTMAQKVDTPSLRVSLDNEKNTIYITCFDANGLQQSVAIDNVPIHSPFRIGLTVSPYLLEGYLNGLLYKSRQLDSFPRPPTTGDRIFAPANIVLNNVVMSKGIRVLNVRTFGYTASASEMKGRMGDLAAKSSFTLAKV